MNKLPFHTGHITDGIGFMQALKDNDIDVIGKKMTIAGAGGAATAIEIQAALDGVKEISIFNIHDKFWANAEETVRKINEKTDCNDKRHKPPAKVSSLFYSSINWQTYRKRSFYRNLANRTSK